MKKFLFSLETLLKHRENVEQREKDEFSRLSYRYQIELQHRDSLVSKRRETMQDLILKYSDNTDRQELTWFYLYLDRLDFEIAESEKRLSKMQAEIKAQKEIVIEASRKRKILSSMKDKKEKEYLLAVEKQEQKDVDELVITQFANKAQ